MIGEFMDKNPDVLKKDCKEDREAVEKSDGKYCFFMDSEPIEYITEMFCSLTQIGGPLDYKGYGIATRKGSKYRTPLSQAILKLQDTGVLQALKDQWWKLKGGQQCISEPSTPMTQLELRDLGGAFFVLSVGAVLAILVAILVN